MVVDITTVDIRMAIAVQVCAGLVNRNLSQPLAVYTLLNEPWDSAWLADLIPQNDLTRYRNPEPIMDFLAFCLASSARGYIRYNHDTQKAVIPNILTVSGVLDAVPLEEDVANALGAKLIFDASSIFANYTALQATEYVYNHYVNRTSTLAFMNPGYEDQKKHPFQPTLTGTINQGLVDFIVKEQVFNFYLNLACMPGTAEHEFMSRMVANNPWPSPIAVFGYDDTFPVAGDIFEAETFCVPNRKMGQVATAGVNNLSFFSREGSIVTPLPQNPAPSEIFDTSRTYVSLVVGDGDNVAYLKSGRRDWMQQRLDKCGADPSYLVLHTAHRGGTLDVMVP